MSALLLFTVAVFALIKWDGLKVWHALIVLGLGFILHRSPFAPYIADALRALGFK